MSVCVTWYGANQRNARKPTLAGPSDTLRAPLAHHLAGSLKCIIGLRLELFSKFSFLFACYVTRMRMRLGISVNTNKKSLIVS